MNKTIEEQLALLKETKDFYDRDTSRRSLQSIKQGDDSNFCVYTNQSGNNCGVGRCMTDEALEDLGDILAPIGSLSDELHNSLKEEDPEAKIKYKEIDDFLKEEYKGFSHELWFHIQTFHDNDGHWDEKGITDEGLERYLELTKMTKLGKLTYKK